MKRAAFLVWVSLLPLMSVPVAASEFNPLGFYIGGAIGQARDTYSAFGASDATRTGRKALAGMERLHTSGGGVAACPAPLECLGPWTVSQTRLRRRCAGAI